MLFGDLWRWLSPFEILASVRGRQFRPATERDWGLQIAGAIGRFLVAGIGVPQSSREDPVSDLVGCLDCLEWPWCSLKGENVVAFTYDPVAALVRLIAAMSPVHVANGYLHLRRPLVGLGQVPTQKGLAALVLIVLGGTLSMVFLVRLGGNRSLLVGLVEARQLLTPLG